MEIDDNVVNLVIEHRAYARVCLFGNVIDMSYGTALSLSIGNFWASVKLEPSKDLVIVPPSSRDLVQFDSLQHLVNQLQTDGYDGGVRLIMALCKIFKNYCMKNNICLHEGNFTLSYKTNIPRQTGLSGSSGILCAALNCLLDFYKVRHLVKAEIRPNLIVNAKEKLGIVAGLEGPVTQVYGGLMYMNFDMKEMKELGHGTYTPLNMSILPPLYLIYAENIPSDSGEVNYIRRYLSNLFFDIKSWASNGRQALIEKQYDSFAHYMNHSFDLQRNMFGDLAIGYMTIKMIAIARSVGAAANFTGTRGAVVAYCPEGTEQANRLRDACRFDGFICKLVEVMPPLLNEVDTKTMSYQMQLTWELCLQHAKLKRLCGENQVDIMWGESS